MRFPYVLLSKGAFSLWLQWAIFSKTKTLFLTQIYGHKLVSWAGFMEEV